MSMTRFEAEAEAKAALYRKPAPPPLRASPSPPPLTEYCVLHHELLEPDRLPAITAADAGRDIDTLAAEWAATPSGREHTAAGGRLGPVDSDVLGQLRAVAALQKFKLGLLPLHLAIRSA